MPTTVERVKAWLRIDPADLSDDALITDCVDAVNAWVGRLDWIPATPDAAATADQGCTMLASRLYRRRNTPSGVETFTDTVIYVPRRDSDVDQLLRIGGYQIPVVG